jgi:hypothetical protein
MKKAFEALYSRRIRLLPRVRGNMFQMSTPKRRIEKATLCFMPWSATRYFQRDLPGRRFFRNPYPKLQ